MTNYAIDITPSQYTPFKRGETIRFSPHLKADSHQLFSGKLTWKLLRNGYEELGRGELDLAEICGYVEHVPDRPGVIQLRCEHQCDDGFVVNAKAGALVEPEKIKPVTTTPPDFEQFWGGWLDRLAAVPVNPVSNRLQHRQFDAYDISADCVGPRPVRGALLAPRDAAPGSCPAVVYFQGAGVRSARSELMFNPLDAGCMVLDVNAHGLDNFKDSSFYNSPLGLEDYRWRGLRGGKPDDCYFLHMFLRAKRALDYIATRPEWDGRNLIVRGASQGALQAFAAAYLDGRVTALAAAVPAGSDILGGGWPVCDAILGMSGPERELLAQVAPYFDNVNFVRGVKAPGRLSFGLADDVCKPDGVQAVANAYAGALEVEADCWRGHSMTLPDFREEWEFILKQIKRT